MNYYTVPIIGSGTETDPYRPDVPANTPFVGYTDGTDFFIAVSSELPLKSGREKQLPRQALENKCKEKGMKYDDVIKWLA